MGLFRLTCKEVSRLQSQSMDRDMRLGERLSLRLHLGICDACLKVSRQMTFLRQALRVYPGPDDDAKD
ncbi:MAG: anti-sigma factor [Betaproteobacteria bacterium]|nr:anti-sigma factor [Betaproteobacteria bacterium]